MEAVKGDVAMRLPLTSFISVTPLPLRVKKACGPWLKIDMTATTGTFSRALAAIRASMPAEPMSEAPVPSLVMASVEPRPDAMLTSSPASLQKPLLMQM